MKRISHAGPTRSSHAAPTLERSDGRRAGATWVAATGAFLLLSAASLFMAVQWRTLPEAAKLALIGALTAGFLAGGRAVRRSLPATGDVLFHLGAFLVPIDVGGLCVRLDADWRTTLVAEGVAGTAVLGLFAAVTGSVVLGWAAGLSVVVLSLGIAAVSPIPAPLLLASAAVVAHLLGRSGIVGGRFASRSSIAWASIAGVAPVVGAGVAGALALLAGRHLGAGTLAEVGLVGAVAAASAAASGGLSAFVLWREAHRRRDLALVALGTISVTGGAATAWIASAPTIEANLLAAPAVFVAVQVIAMVAARDPFWRRPAASVAISAEVVAALIAPLAVMFAVAAPIVEEGLDLGNDAPPWSPDPAAALSWALLAAGWLLGAWRRQLPRPSLGSAARAALGDDRTVFFLSVSVMAALVVGTASTFAIAGGLLVLAGALAFSRGILATIIAVPVTAWAVVTPAVSHPGAVLPAGLAGAAVLAWAARLWVGRGGAIPTFFLSSVAAFIVLASAAFTGAGTAIGMAPALLVAVFAAWALAAFVEGAWEPAGHASRSAMAIAALIAVGGSDLDLFTVALAATVLFVVDAVRRDIPWIGLGTGVTAPLAVVAAGAGAGLDTPETGVLLALAAVVLAGIAALSPPRWRAAVLAPAGTSIALALALSTGHAARFAEVVILFGGLVIAGALSLQRPDHRSIGGHTGGILVTIGIALHLAADGITATEAYVAPVALQLAILGWQLRRPAAVGEEAADANLSSWIAFGPSIVLLGGAGLVERLDGGPAWHALVAGAVGVSAVAAGGWRRLAGPLFLGTSLVVTVTVLETLHTLAGVPTWAWLAAGGTALLAAGIGLERSATSPSEVGRRLVDVVADRFD